MKKNPKKNEVLNPHVEPWMPVRSSGSARQGASAKKPRKNSDHEISTGCDQEPLKNVRKTDRRLRSQLCEQAGTRDLRFMSGYDDCIVGLAQRFGMESVVAYDKAKVIKSLMADGMSEDEAEEWFSVNQIGAWIGPYTPVFIECLGG